VWFENVLKITKGKSEGQTIKWPEEGQKVTRTPLTTGVNSAYRVLNVKYVPN
jgi:hypothetical protein